MTALLTLRPLVSNQHPSLRTSCQHGCQNEAGCIWPSRLHQIAIWMKSSIARPWPHIFFFSFLKGQSLIKKKCLLMKCLYFLSLYLFLFFIEKLWWKIKFENTDLLLLTVRKLLSTEIGFIFVAEVQVTGTLPSSVQFQKQFLTWRKHQSSLWATDEASVNGHITMNKTLGTRALNILCPLGNDKTLHTRHYYHSYIKIAMKAHKITSI